MKKVLRYLAPIGAGIGIKLPSGAKPLHFNIQWDQLYLWALVDPSAPLKMKWFHMVTDQPVEEYEVYINTLCLKDGALVYHFFH